MHKIISPTQTAFLKGRLILDSFVTASEIIIWCSKVQTECVGIKADFENAFDRMNWDFLKSILKWLGLIKNGAIGLINVSQMAK